MNEIIYDIGYNAYRSIIEETDPKKCSKNLNRRIKELKIDDLTEIICYSNKKETYVKDAFGHFKKIDFFPDQNTLCLCGHKIEDVFIVKGIEHKAMIGSACIKKFCPKLYSECLKIMRNTKKIYCQICNKTSVLDHFKTKIHNNRFSELYDLNYKNKYMKIYEKERIKNKVNENLLLKINNIKCLDCSKIIPRSDIIVRCLDCWKIMKGFKKNLYIVNNV